ncbi:MAG: (2Fe-2S)-binding protein [Acidobacteria bacterium]|nr:(2Fe-2S)-binding protein [Acidobacteriota bacterium]
MDHDNTDKPAPATPGVSRRGFITSVGTGAIGVAAAASLVSAAPPETQADVVAAGGMSSVSLVVNGRRHTMLVEPRWSLLYVLRDRLGLTGTKIGCERGECGACTVLIDGKARYACMTLAVEADGRDITTIEGLMTGEELGTTQQAFADEDAFQCGYCTPGQVMAAESLLRVNPSPTLDEIRQGMAGNLCRCGAYAHIFKAVAKAADLKRQGR